MFYSKETKMKIAQSHLMRLRTKPVENFRHIRKLERELRLMENEERNS